METAIIAAGAALLGALIAAIAAISGSLIGVIVPYNLEKRKIAVERYDNALRAIAQLQAARHGSGFSIPENFTGATGEKHKSIVQEISKSGLEEFISCAAEARKALAELHANCPDLEKYWNKFEVTEEEMKDLTAILAKRKQRPKKIYASDTAPATTD